MKKKLLTLIFIITLLCENVNAHTIPSSSIPRLSYQAILALPSPHKGDMAYDLTNGLMRLYTSSWGVMATLPDPPCDSFTALSGPGNYFEIVYDVTTDNAGNVFILGEFYGTVEFDAFTITAAGDADVFIAKYNSSGTIQWVKRAGGQYNDFGTGITVDNIGNIYITGYFYYTMNFNDPSAFGSNEVTSAGETDAFFAKYNSSGDVQWARSTGGPDNDNSGEITVDGNGNAFVIGNFWGTINFSTAATSGTNQLTSVGGQDVFIAKYNTSGVLAWVKRAGGVSYDYGNGITVDSGGNIYATGGFNETLDFNTPSTSGSNELVSDGDYDIFVAKLNTDGTVQWLKRAGGVSADIGVEIAVDNSGNIYVTGSFRETINFNNPSTSGSNELVSAGEYDIFISKYNTSGNVLWLKRIGGTENDYGSDLKLDNSGNAYLLGIFAGTINFNNPSSSGSNELVSTGGNDILIAKYSPSGEFIWKRSAGGTGIDQATALAIGSSGTIHATGYYQNISQFGSSTLDSDGNIDFFLTYITVPPPAPTEVSVSSTSICSGTSISLSATCAIGTVTWYNQQTGGTSLGTGTAFSQSPTVNTTYYASCIDGTCESGRIATNPVIVTPLPASPTGTSNPVICNNSTASLSATCATGTIKWYSANGTTLLFTGSPFITPTLSANTSYKVLCDNGTCPSNFVVVGVRVNSPKISASTNPQLFSSVTSFNNINVGSYSKPAFSDIDGDGLLDLLIGENSGKLVHYKQASANSLTFNFVTNSFSGINANIFPSPTLTDIDGDGLSDLIAGNLFGKLYHYEQAAANSLTYNFITNNFLGINPGDYSAPTFTDLDGDGLLDLIVGKDTGELIHYEQASANSSTFNLVTNTFNNIDVGSSSRPTFTDIDGDGLLDLIIGSFHGTFVHYEQASANSLTFNLVTNTFNGISAAYEPIPTFTDLDGDGLLDLIIGKDAGTLSRSEQLAGSFTNFSTSVGTPTATQTVQVWGGPCLNDNILVTAPTGFEVSLSAGSGFGSSVSLIPSGGKVVSTTVYVRFNPSSAGLFTGNLQINAPNTNAASFALTGCTPSPVPNTTNPTICFNTAATLTATCATGTVSWYNSSSGYLMATGSPFVTPLLTSNTSYSVRCEGCNISDFVDVLITVTPPLNAPYNMSIPTVCSISTGSLSANCQVGTVKWYNANGTTLLFSGSPFVTPNLTSTTSYKLDCELGSCKSAFNDVVVTVIPLPVVTSNPTICFNSTASLSASCATGTVKWYSSNSTTLLFTGSPFVTPNLSANTNYNVRCDIGTCATSFVAVAVKVNISKISASKNPQLFSSISAFNNINVVYYSNPTFTDIDNDGLLDLIIGENFGTFKHYKQASANSLTFSLVTNTFNGIDVPNSSSPAFTDIDGDGLLDFIFGEYDGNLYHYEQTSVNGSTFSLVTNAFNNIDLNSNSKPVFTDLDGDGLLDLIIGEYGGTLVHYEQASTNSLIFSLVTETFNNIDVGFLSAPTFTDLDGDGLLDLIIGNAIGTINHYEQASTNSLTFNLVTNNFNNIDIGFESVPAFADLDGNGVLDLIIGRDDGTLSRTEQLAGTFSNYTTSVGTPTATQTVQVWGGSCLNGNITVSAPTGFEVSLSVGSGFGSSISLTPSGGKVVNTTVYVRFNPSSAGSFTGNLQITSANANTVNFTLNGCTPTNAPTGTSNPTICNGTTASLSATCATGIVSWYNSSSSTLLATTSSFVTPVLTSNTTYNVRCEGCSISSFVPVSVTVNAAVAAPTGTANSTICNNTSASLSASCSSSTLKWYDAGGTSLQGTGSPFVTPNLTSTTTYKVRCESGGSPNCSSAFVDVTVTVNPAVSAPTGTANSTICNNTTASLSATCSSSTVKWYDAGGTSLQGTGSPFVTPNLSSNSTYKVRCESGGSPNCISAFVDVTITVNPAVASPTGTSNPPICNNTTASLSASCSSSSVKWYDAGGTSLQGTGSPFVSPNLTSTTTYKVRCESGGSPNCTSAFVDVTVTVNPAVSAPTGTANPTICNNTTASLSASCNSSTVKWYDVSGTSLQGTGSPFVSPNLTSNTTYKVRCESGGSPNCISAFVDVTVTVNAAVSAPTGTSNPTICNNTSASLSASCSSSTVKWYDAGGTSLQGTGSPFVTPNLTTNTTYKVRCESGGSPNCTSAFVDVTVTVNATVSAPTGTSNPTICNNAPASLSATCSSSSVKWYDAGGTSLQGTGSPFVSPNLTSNTTYKVRCESGGSPNCISAFVDVTVTVNAAVSAPTGTSNSTICNNATASLSASCSSGSVKWYDTNGTALQGTGSPFVTPNLTATTTYKVRCEFGSCNSSFTTVLVTVTPILTNPTAVSTSSTGICVGSSVTLSATCQNGTITWYNQQSGGTSLGTGNGLSQSPTTNTTYYASCESGICTSGRTATNTVLVVNSSANLTITSDISSGNSLQIATQNITATNKIISPANVTYKAGNAILLNAGFEAKAGSVFKAQIGGCSN